MKKFFILLYVIASCSLMVFGAPKPKFFPQSQAFTFNLALIEQPQADKYANLSYGIRLNVQDVRANQRIIQIYDASATSIPASSTNPSLTSFAPESMRRYMRTMGFNLDADVATDYLMQIDIKEFHSDYLSGIGWNGTVMMDIKVLDHSRTVVYPSVEISGRASINGNANSQEVANLAMNKAYANALADVDWDRIAFILHKQKKDEETEHASAQKAKLVKAPIHWEIQSRPQGADVYWRVISSTEEVKNQNSKYLETTPYETTEPFDIKGLTYENSENVQIEIRCEKEGYATQKKRFNLNSILDEKELSVFFKLVKLEDAE